MKCPHFSSAGDKLVEKLDGLPLCKTKGIRWEVKPHNEEIQVVDDYVGTQTFSCRNDVDLVSEVCEFLAKRLVVCRGALWFIQKNGTATVALPDDRAKRDVIQQQLIAELASCQLVLQSERDVPPCLIHESMSMLFQLSRNVCGQAVVNNDFEREY